MYQALYRKYRPQTFDDLVGQQAVTQTLKSQLITRKLSHAYLFVGSRGTGKTSSAKILAKAVNCLNPQDGNPCNCCSACQSIDSGACMDVLEIDAASNNSVDNVRDLRDDAIYSPSQVRMRVYIIDEVHMLSISAFNALLKIIEEPPEHLLFILATTELHKVPATILSRCQRFSFRRISQEDIAARLQYVAYQESIDLDDSAARLLARLADGGLRDALSLLDQCATASSGELTAERVYSCLGIAGIRECGSLMRCIADHNTSGALSILNRLYADGKDMGALLDELACLTRDFMILKTAGREGISMLSGVASDQEVADLSNRFSTGELIYMMNRVQRTLSGLSHTASRRMDAELCIVSLCQPELAEDISSVIARVTRIEDTIRSGQLMISSKPDSQSAQHLEDSPPPPDDGDAPPDIGNSDSVQNTEEPVGFWTDLAAAIRKDLSPSNSGFFSVSPNPMVKGVLRGNVLTLVCNGKFILDMINKPEILTVVSQKASAKVGARVTVKLADGKSAPVKNEQMEQLLRFGREHSDFINIKE